MCVFIDYIQLQYCGIDLIYVEHILFYADFYICLFDCTLMTLKLVYKICDTVCKKMSLLKNCFSVAHA